MAAMAGTQGGVAGVIVNALYFISFSNNVIGSIHTQVYHVDLQ